MGWKRMDEPRPQQRQFMLKVGSDLSGAKLWATAATEYDSTHMSITVTFRENVDGSVEEAIANWPLKAIGKATALLDDLLTAVSEAESRHVAERSEPAGMSEVDAG